MTTPAATLKARKLPVQDRSRATREALHAAVIQVLVRDGVRQCTTTRVAERAGVSVGSLYQYYPNRDALLADVLSEHLTGIADAMSTALTSACGKPVAEVAAALVTSFLETKLRNPNESSALYAVSEELGGSAMIAQLRIRTLADIADALRSAPDIRLNNPEMIGAIAFGALIGPVRSVLEGHLARDQIPAIKDELIVMVTAYLKAAGNIS
ncbi:TetR/AcrR family transcriptional regulator [Paracoccus xiamenensis]|uniref:TetR/AcrR family transcriptional regulator n=1 Tax=Paracoccus xiamenensis TaxID=2714901 RepID=UPI0014093F76|nr:TetR/AcrR family transcriptional regulator [Paracoccus xiamenensis]NHF72592.1 TetR/AcrR family transcriptional regulator [Paracoccus xiamenensis]